MNLNVLKETPKRLNEVAGAVPPRGVTKPTLIRWARSGVKRSDGEVVKLEHCRIGTAIYTSDEALQRFLEKINA